MNGADDSSSAKRTRANNRVVGNQDPIGDFDKVVSDSSGNELMEKAVSWAKELFHFLADMVYQMADLGEVVKENLSSSFSTSGFKKALKCLQVMRKQAMIVG